jgi:hypothetical protein
MERFWSKVDKSGECWEWKANRLPGGYGTFWLSGKQITAHRMAYKLSYGEIPARMCVCHRCDNRGCVRPDHLWLGTYSENSRDMWKKGRGPLRRNPRRGEQHYRAILTLGDVEFIRTHRGEYTVQALADKFGVAKSTIHAAQISKNWRKNTLCAVP